MAKAEPTTRKLEISIPNINFQRVLVVALIVMAFAIGMLYQKVQVLQGGNTVANNATPSTAQQPAATNVTIDQIKGLWNKDLVKFGDASRKVLFVEIGDPSCPYCHAATGENHTIYSALGGSSFKLVADGGSYVAPITEMRKLVDNNQASFVYVYYPGHGNGEMGMKAMYCANEKGKFWAAHDLLMSSSGYDLMNTTIKNDKTQSQALANFLKNAVDASFLKSCLDSGKYDARLASDMAVAGNLNVRGTPGFFVNATSYPGAYAWSDIKSTVDAALK